MLRRAELGPILNQFKQLPKQVRQPVLPNPEDAVPAKRKIPKPPPGGLIIRGYCTYLKRSAEGKISKPVVYYYKDRPERWTAETQTDVMWLQKKEWQALVPEDPQQGSSQEVDEKIQRRFFGTIAIEYMEGSNAALPSRETSMALTVESVDDDRIEFSMKGYGKVGKEFDPTERWNPGTRGSEVRVLGRMTYDRKKDVFTRFDIAGYGDAWGNWDSNANSNISRPGFPWQYGIACEIETNDTPASRWPPYNVLHYNKLGPYYE